MNRGWNISCEGHLFNSPVRIRGWAEGEERNGIRVPRIFKECRAIGQFHNFPEIHDSDSVAYKSRCGQVMGDEKVGYVELLLERFHQV